MHGEKKIKLKAKKDDLARIQTGDPHKYMSYKHKQSGCDSFHHQVLPPLFTKVYLYLSFWKAKKMSGKKK
jgi:hypothetical protein